ncbi:MAG TPA: hypothetical protein VNT79_13500, partial [Phycisphaerae bacterium]|nr:hypothetical protein [Phycisphaerae bacterium]
MDQSSLLRLLVAVLERLQIRYIVTGSVASTAYGEPRFTYDIDVVADLQSSQVKSFSAAFP